MPSKSMPRKDSHDFNETYPYFGVGTFVSMRITDILAKNSLLFCSEVAV